MKKCFTLIAAAVMAFAANAQDLTIATNGLNPNIKVTEARFDPCSMNLGNTSTNTIVDLGEVDFGADGQAYKAAGIRFAQGWQGDDSFALLSAGADYETALPFTQIGLMHTQSYSWYRTLAGNMGFNATSESELSGGRVCQDGLRFTKPTGKQHVFLTFVNGAGNVQAIYFYNNAFAAADFAENGKRLLEPNEKADYDHITLAIENAVLVASPSEDTRVDTNSNSWGWTTNGVLVNYGTVNFGNGEYKQIACNRMSHWSNNMTDYLEFYIDNANEPANLIGRLWTGLELRDRTYTLATSIDKEVTGEHTLFVKWVGGSSNIGDVEVVKGVQWYTTPFADIVTTKAVNEKIPTEGVKGVKHYTMRNNAPEGAIKIANHAVLNEGRLEGNGNYGYTNSKTVLKLENIDFENGQYNKIYMNYATGGSNWIDYKENANISLYIDLEADGKTYDWKNAHEALADVEPIAVVRHQATGGWGNQYNISDDLAKVTGVHTVYVVYYQKYTNEGANIFDYYLVSEKRPAITGISIKGEEIALEEGVKNYALTLKEEFTADDVVVTTVDAEDLVLSIKIEEASMLDADEYLVTIELLDDAGAAVDAYTVNVTVEMATGINDIKTISTKVVKMIENGQIVIVKGDARYNIMGQPIR